jgi:tRNA modification GTPase
MHHSTDTIAAIATPPGRGGVGIIRISGKQAKAIAETILGLTPKPRYAHYGSFKDQSNNVLDNGIAIYFPSPNSFTGEDVLELQGHGGQIVLDMLLETCIALGARLANPGEFSERAFLNNKMDLAQAEAISDLIDSNSRQAAKSALRSLQGEFSTSINQLRQQLIELRIYVEAALDFPDEEIDFLADASVLNRLDTAQQQFDDIYQRAEQGRILREGMNLVIAGRPNAGKSSLLNALAGTESAIVTDIAGTTRDVVKEHINLDGMPLHIIDTAGLRESNDPVEQIGIQKAWQAIEEADLVLILIDDSQQTDKYPQEIVTKLPEHLPRITVYNKIDLSQHAAGIKEDTLYISAKHQQGIPDLKEHLKTRMGYQSNTEGTFIARRRHIEALQRTQDALQNARTQLTVFNAGELMAEELKLAQDALGEITGKMTADDLLGEIFSSFCIGK